MGHQHDAKNEGIKRLALESMKAIVEEMLELPSTEVLWNHVYNIASCASAIQDELNGTKTDTF